MNSDLAVLDKEVATLRILRYFSYDYRSESRRELLDALEKVGVGRSAFYSSFKTLQRLGYIEESEVEREGRRFKVTTLSAKGFKIAGWIRRLEEYLAE